MTRELDEFHQAPIEDRDSRFDPGKNLHLRPRLVKAGILVSREELELPWETLVSIVDERADRLGKLIEQELNG